MNPHLVLTIADDSCARRQAVRSAIHLAAGATEACHLTGAAPVRRQAPATGDAPIRGFLQTVHASWLEEVRGILNPARRETAGVWARWRANQYLGTDFAPRLAHARGAITGARRLLVAINDLAEVDNLAYLLRFDTVYGRFPT